jgi:hypothetical protein
MHEAAKHKLDHRIDELENRLTKLRAIRAALDDEEIAPDLAELFGSGGRNQETHFDKMRAFFESTENEWATAKWIARKTGVSWAAVRQVLYKTNKGAFESQDHPKGGRTKQFRLKQEVQQPAG